MATYVLVHGAWGGAHGWRKVRPGLSGAGHTVTTPSLTGIGERVHLASPQVTLTTHVQDVVHHVLYEDLSDIVLLGYSYGGMVVTGAIRYLAGRIRELVYLDAFLPEHGQSLDDLTGRQPERELFGLGLDKTWLVEGIARTYEPDVNLEWQAARRSMHPLGCFVAPVRLDSPIESYGFGRTYIKATGEPRPPGDHPFWRAADRTRVDPEHWRYREIPTNHMIPQNMPDELVEILLELA